MPPFGPLVDAAWLRKHLDDVVVADVRWYLDGRSGRAAYESGHIPGAVFIDLDHALAAPPESGPGRHPLPAPDAFARSMGAAGIADDTTVVVYDDAGGSVAARLWWMLNSTGHRAAVLDGGLGAWREPLETGPGEARERAAFTPVAWPAGAFTDADGVATSAGVVLDVRIAPRYRGEFEPIDPRAGHIPGAVNAPWSEAIAEGGRFRAAGELADRFRSLGVERAEEVIVYCGSGVNACHGILALEVAGLGRARLYEGSWSDWSSDPARPIETAR